MNHNAPSRSLAGRLSFTVGLSTVLLTVAVLALVLALLLQRIEGQMEAQAQRSVSFLAESLAVPLWSLDLDAARAIGQALAQDEQVGLVEISGARGEVFYRQDKGGPLLLERGAQVLHAGQVIGSARLGLNDSLRRQALWGVALAGAGLVAVIVVLLSLLQIFLFRPLLRKPFAALDGLVRAYAAGDFSPAPPAVSYIELASLVRLLLDMGGTIRKQVEALKKSEERLSLALDAANDGLWDLDVQSGATFFSPRYCAMLGYEPGEFEGIYDSWRDLLHSEDLARAERAMAACLHGLKPFEIEFRLRAKSGQWRWILSRGRVVARDAEGRALRMVGTHTDISERKAAEEALRQSEEKFSRLFRLSPDAILLVHLDREDILDVNQTFCRMFGYAREEVLGLSTADIRLYRNARDRVAFFERLRGVGHLENMEIEARRKDGATLHCSLSSQILTLAGEAHILSVLRDVSETKKMQEMMVQTEKMISVGGIAAGIAHEINNPLGIVLQAAQNLAQRMRPDFPKNQAAARELGLDLDLFGRYIAARKLDVFIEDIRAAALRASAIIRHMLDFSRRSESRRKVCDLPAIVQRALALAQSDYDLKKSYDFRRIDVRLEIGDDLPEVTCTETEMEQVLLNLLRNAAQAMAEAEPAIAAPGIEIRLSARPGAVRIEVADNGPGMAPEVQRRIFEPFFTTKAPGVGTGLGLSVSYFIVTKGHGGSMQVESAPGQGTRFVIDLPTGEPGEGRA